MYTFEQLKAKWEDKVIEFDEFDEVLNALDTEDEDESNHPYTFENIGIQIDGTSRWDCNSNESLEEDESGFTECEYFTFYTKD